MFNYERDAIFCENDFDDKTMRALANTMANCPTLQNSMIDFSIKLSKNKQIVDKSFDIFNFTNYVPPFIFEFGFTFLNLKGFDIETNVDLKYISNIHLYSDFNLYKRNSLVRGCQDFTNISNSRGFIFQLKFQFYREFVLHMEYSPILSPFT